MQIPGDPAPQESFGVIKTINKYFANAESNLLVLLYWIHNDTPICHDTLKMVLKNLENENGCETMFLHSDSPSCLHYKGLPSLNLGVCTHSYRKKQTRKNMEHIRTHTGKHNSWILIQKFNENSASQDTPCDDSYTPCACWPPQSIFNCGELAC